MLRQVLMTPRFTLLRAIRTDMGADGFAVVDWCSWGAPGVPLGSLGSVRGLTSAEGALLLYCLLFTIYDLLFISY